MKAMGIVRRIDDLGRVVIPKEICRTMCIYEPRVFLRRGRSIDRSSRKSGVNGLGLT